MKHKLSAALALSCSEWFTLCQAWVYLLAVDIALRGVSFSRVQRLVGATAGARSNAPDPDAGHAVCDLKRLVDIAARYHLYSMTCLRRSLVLQGILKRRGIRTELRIGVSKDADKLRAHAWLEFQGRLIGEAETTPLKFKPLVSSGTGI